MYPTGPQRSIMNSLLSLKARNKWNRFTEIRQWFSDFLSSKDPFCTNLSMDKFLGAPEDTGVCSPHGTWKPCCQDLVGFVSSCPMSLKRFSVKYLLAMDWLRLLRMVSGYWTIWSLRGLPVSVESWLRNKAFLSYGVFLPLCLSFSPDFLLAICPYILMSYLVPTHSLALTAACPMARNGQPTSGWGMWPSPHH